ncbi:GCN5 family acetyltransferase [Exiguobacterium sp. SH31]|uniref:GNAT family N-acetyltransferase n=1 Tax=Exiguobacterium sp. SH31 TaxID=1843183 RepID=UPI0008D1A08E|nr:GNAT family N-acetyltransferase [Exiguobacterium sp. SH31]OGX80667.1 GCN5 family acetyltransferase [Exiguobacterium sp. SH31]
MQIRKAEPKDAYGIARVRVNGWRTTYRGIVPTEILLKLSSGSIEWSEKIRSALSNREVRGFVAIVDEEIVGFVLYGDERTGDYPDHPNEIYAIYILEEHQRNGLGSMLLEKAVHAMHGHGLIIWSLELNPHRAFYEQKQGQVIDSKERLFGELSLREIAYGWTEGNHDAIVGA